MFLSHQLKRVLNFKDGEMCSPRSTRKKVLFDSDSGVSMVEEASQASVNDENEREKEMSERGEISSNTLVVNEENNTAAVTQESAPSISKPASVRRSSPYNQLRTDELFNKYKLLKLDDIYTLQAGIFVHKFLTPGELPLSFKDYFRTAVDVSERELHRNTSEIYIPTHDSSRSNHLPNISIAQSWNSLESEYRLSSPKTFKQEFMNNITY